MTTVVLRPKTEDAKSILESHGDVWTMAISAPDPVYGSQKRLFLEPRADFRSKGMWVDEKYDTLFEVVWL